MAAFRNKNDVEARLCKALDTAIQNRDANELQSIVLLEPPFPPVYQELIGALQKKYPQNDSTSEERLVALVKWAIPETAESEDEQGRPVQSWSAMVTFVVRWLTFLRDMDPDDLLRLYQLLSDLVQQSISALGHPIKGILMLPTIMNYAKVLARVAVGLDRQPWLIEHLLANSNNEDGGRESLSEKAANTVRQAFIICLNDRNTVPGGVRDGKPDGKKIGIYKMANLCLKILIQADKLESCTTIFKNIMNSSPPLHIYPAAERVTYLYYLGLYLFAYTEFYPAQKALQKAYEDSPSGPQFVGQRRLILVYLIASNIILGRLPNEQIYDFPEAKGFREAFTPITQAIRKGDLEAFRRITNLDRSHPSADFLCHYKMFYQFGNYCEPLVWRSLLRKVFLLTGAQGGSAQSAAVLDLNVVQHIFQYLENRAKIKNAAIAAQDLGPGRRNFGHVYQDYASISKSTYIDPDFVGMEGIKPYDPVVSQMEIIAICGSLITQGLLNGYISPKAAKLAISGARRPGGALKHGFPLPWHNIVQKNQGEDKKDPEILGWKQDGGTVGQGQVVRLAGARAAGS